MENKGIVKEDKKINSFRQIIIETNGDRIEVVKAEVASKLEFIKILEEVIKAVREIKK